MKKNILITSLMTLTAFLVFLTASSNITAVGITDAQKKIHTNNNLTISVALSQFKNVKEVQESFPYADNNTKVLAIKENDGYGFMQGGAEIRYADGKIVQYNADTDPNSATVGDIITAVEK